MPTHPGDVVKEELEERGISQKEFASRTGISYTMLNEILNSKRPITSEIALVIEATLGNSHWFKGNLLLRPRCSSLLCKTHKIT